ncbi:SMP-30/gluconolactonase/LRE family protein [Bacillus cereus]|uniref:SMP-30/gluconolaconase/LRE domain protein n=1 Tax=Bacillus cereus TaxID=1396 RepID=A0A2B1KT31_BACCE|nr:SMP-30/gluconolactonase/LRE family protein [Bacillus cereus]PEX86823.1 SMP-30/gluconolaconase/LRE domain protein [Bacillus cereus]PFN27867.1 SMP-30/gluconolaconase/LRE domain protein [Bacillus cereus]
MIELIIDAKSSLSEGPCWDEKKQILYWVDIIEKKLCLFDPIKNTNRLITFDQQIGCVVPYIDDVVLLAMERGFYSLNLNTEKLTHIYDPEPHLLENRFNDGKCDPAGRFWAGTTDLYGIHAAGSLYCLHNNFTVDKKVVGVNTSNGIAWSPDHAFLYFIDTPTKKVVRFEYDIHTGEIRNPIDVIIFSENDGLPDGMTIDEEGCLWIAHWGGSKVTRWNPMTGKQLLSIPIPALYVTSCTFGGSDLTDLYITTARTRMTDEELKQYPHAGGIFRIQTNVKGCPTYSFRYENIGADTL